MSARDLASASRTSQRKVVVIGAGFAGMAVVRELRDSNAEVTLVDRNNHHLFQPFLFQVATSILEPAEIATVSWIDSRPSLPPGKRNFS